MSKSWSGRVHPLYNSTTAPFMICCAISLVNVMGTQFLVPVLVQYGQHIGGDLDEIALFSTIRFASSSVANLLLPYLADAWSKKWTLVFGLACCVVGSIIRALAWNFHNIALAMMYIGGAVVGVGGAVNPILKAHIPMITMPDEQLVDRRLTLLGCTYDCIIVLCCPVAGMLGSLSLVYPFWVVVVASIAVLVATSLFFLDCNRLPQSNTMMQSNGAVKAVLPAVDSRTLLGAPCTQFESPKLAAWRRPCSSCCTDPNDSACACRPGRAVGKFMRHDQSKAVNWGTLLCDPVVWLLFVSRFFINVTTVGIPIMLPYFLESDPTAFSVEGADVDTTRGNISFVFGLLCSAQGAFSLVFMLFLNETLCNNLGEVLVVSIGTAIFVASLGLCALTRVLWPLYIYFSLFGVGIGLLWRAMVVFPPKYVCTFYPSNAARVIALVSFGSNLGSMCGQSILSALVQVSMNAGWVVLASCTLFSVMLFLIARAIGAKRLAGAKW